MTVYGPNTFKVQRPSWVVFIQPRLSSTERRGFLLLYGRLELEHLGRMSTCETCRWWGVDTPVNPENLHLIRLPCSYTHMTSGAGMLDDGGAFPEGDVSGRILTGPCFGCVNHESKTT